MSTMQSRYSGQSGVIHSQDLIRGFVAIENLKSHFTQRVKLYLPLSAKHESSKSSSNFAYVRDQRFLAAREKKMSAENSRREVSKRDWRRIGGRRLKSVSTSVLPIRI